MLTAAQSSVGARVLAADAARHRQARLRGARTPARSARSARPGCRSPAAAIGRVGGERAAEPGVAAPASATQHVGHGERERRLGARPDREPLVGVEAGELHAAAPAYTNLATSPSAKPCESAKPRWFSIGREPGLEKVRAERQDVLGLGEVVRRKPVDAEDLLVGGAERLVIERLPAHQPSADGARSTRVSRSEKVPRPRPRDHRHLAAGRPSLAASAAIASSQVISLKLPSAARAMGAWMRPGL